MHLFWWARVSLYSLGLPRTRNPPAVHSSPLCLTTLPSAGIRGMYCCVQLNLKHFCHLREKSYVHQQSPLCASSYHLQRGLFPHSRSCVLDSSYGRSHTLCGLSLPAGSCLALWLNETPCKDGSVGFLTLYSCHILFTWPSAYESIPYFHLLIMSDVAVNIHGHIFVWTNVFTSLGHICWGQILS